MEHVVDSTCAADPANETGNSEYLLQSRLVCAMANLSMYKRHEVTSLLEQWLWKMAISCTQNKDGGDGDAERLVCRAKCGASFIIPIVKTFLDDTTWKTSF